MLEFEIPTEPKTREYILSNGNKLRAKQTDPYGFWFLSLERGELPEEFKGAYSNLSSLDQAVQKYQSYRDLAVVPELPERPKLERKPIKA